MGRGQRGRDSQRSVAGRPSRRVVRPRWRSMRPARARGCSASWRRRARSGARPAWRCAPNGSGVFCAKRGGPCVPADCCCTAPVPSTLRRTKECCATSRCGRLGEDPAARPNGSRSIRRGASRAARSGDFPDLPLLSPQGGGRGLFRGGGARTCRRRRAAAT